MERVSPYDNKILSGGEKAFRVIFETNIFKS